MNEKVTDVAIQAKDNIINFSRVRCRRGMKKFCIVVGAWLGLEQKGTKLVGSGVAYNIYVLQSSYPMRARELEFLKWFIRQNTIFYLVTLI